MKKVSILFVLTIQLLLAKTQDSISFDFNFNHLALSVKDVQAAVDFYTKVFQLQEITNRSAQAGIRWVSLGEGKELHLISTIKDPVVTNKAIHLAMATQQYNAFTAHLDKLGIMYYDWPGKEHTVNVRADGVKQVYLKDPDGYWIEINNGYAKPKTGDEIKNDIWQLEENYWKYVKTNDLAAYLTLWDDQFIGYPSTNKIGGKDHISDWIKEMYKNNAGKTYSYKLTRQVENVFGDIVIVLYDVTQVWTDEKTKRSTQTTFKITQTWKKTSKGWLIIGGMGAKK